MGQTLSGDKRTLRKANKDVFEKVIAEFRNGTTEASEPSSQAIRSVVVYARKRPITELELQDGEFDAVTMRTAARGEVVIHDAQFKSTSSTDMTFGVSHCSLTHSSFIFDEAFSENCDNDTVYKATAQPLLRSLSHGDISVATIFMFGQTGSGKTYTMNALLERFMSDILGDSEVALSLSIFEIAGRSCRDLLADENDATVRMLEDSEGGVQLLGARCESVNDATQWLAHLQAACCRRATHGTGVHAQSSRSHAVYKLVLNYPGGESRSLTCVDLAGSEWSKDSDLHDGARMKECIQINQSLMVLKQCIRLRRDVIDGQASQDGESNSGTLHMPFRESLLTRLLKDAFTLPASHSRTIVVATVSPSSGDTEHTLSTLKHASLLDDAARCFRSKTAELGRIQVNLAPQTAAQKAKTMSTEQKRRDAKKRQALAFTWKMLTTVLASNNVAYDELQRLFADAGLAGSAASLSEDSLKDICTSVQAEQPEADHQYLQFVEFESFMELASQGSGLMVSKIIKPLQATLLTKMEDGAYKDWFATQVL
jgi:hypothetical protein